MHWLHHRCYMGEHNSVQCHQQTNSESLKDSSLLLTTDMCFRHMFLVFTTSSVLAKDFIFVKFTTQLLVALISRLSTCPHKKKKKRTKASERNTSIQKHQNFKNGLKAFFLANHLTEITQIKQ